MSPFRWGLLGVALFVAFTHGASFISSTVNDDNDDVEPIDEALRSKRSYKRGQTQSQYLNFGQPELDGKAEAQATESGSRSIVAGSHGMGQAQSQFSSGDCSGCGLGSPVYEYSTGSPDPLTLGENVIPYADGKPSSILGLHGTAPGGVLSPDGSFPTGFIGQAGKPGAAGPLIPGLIGQLGQPGISGGGSGTGSALTPGVGVAGQIGSPGSVGSNAPGTNGRGQFGRPHTEGSNAPGRSNAGGPYIPSNGYAPGVLGTGQIGKTGTEGAFTPNRGQISDAGQVIRPGSTGVFAPGTSGSSSAGDIYAPGSGYIPGTSVVRQTGGPNTSDTFSPGSGYTPGTSTGQEGRPSATGTFVPGNGYVPVAHGKDQAERSGTGGTYSPGSGYIPGTSVARQTGGPNTSYTFSPGSGYTPGTSTGQEGRPSATGTFVPGNGYVPVAAGKDQVGRPGTGGIYSPGSGYIPETSVVRQTGDPNASDTFSPGSGYTPGTSTGQAGRPSITGTFVPGNGYVPVTAGKDQVGRPGMGGRYSPGSGYAPGSDISGLPERPGSGDTYAPGIGYGSRIPSTGQIGTPGAGHSFAPASGYAPGTVGQTGTYPPHSVGQVGAPGTSFSYGPVAGSRGVGEPGASDFVKPGVGGAGGQGQVQYPTPHLIAPPMTPAGTIQGPQTGIGFGAQVPSYGRSGQQIPAFTPGYSVQGGGKQQAPQYAPGGQPAYGLEERRPDIVGGQPQTSYGHPGQQISDQKVSQPGSIYGPSTGYTSGYAPGYMSPTAGSAALAPQQVLQQSGPGTILRPGTGGMQQGVASPSPHHGNGLQPSYEAHPGGNYGQPGYGTQTIQGSGYQPGGSFGQLGTGGQQSHVTPSVGYGPSGPNDIPPSGGVFQPSNGQTSGGFIQPGSDRTQYPQFGGVVSQPVGLQPPGSGRQTSSGAVHPSAGTQPGTVYKPTVGGTFGQPSITGQQGAGIPHRQQAIYTQSGGSQPDQRGTSFQPSSETSAPGTAVHQVPSGFHQTPGYNTGYGQPGTGESYPQQTTYGGIQQPSRPGQQTGLQEGSTFDPYSATGRAPLPASSVLNGAGTHQGSGIGTDYDRAYTQPFGGQPGYGQIGSVQYGHPGRGQPGDAGVRQPGSTVPQYSHGAQQIVQPGAAYIPGGAPTSGLQQPAAGGQISDVGDDAFSQAESSMGNGQAAASAQGRKNGGTAKTQVQGTYSSTGSFSASAMTSDNDRSASSQVTGGVEGAMSQSQGQGGAAQSQAQVQVNEKTGATKASSQSGGIIQQSQSEVQANDKGGLADAQSSGPGQTSSQAQIGFRPGQDGEIVRSAGGGQASAQSGAHSGNSQSQIQGTSKYGVSYHGAAQSASGTKEQVATYREQNRDLFNKISHFGGSDAVTDRVDTVFTPALTSESGIPDLQLKTSKTNKEATNSNKLDDDSILTDEEDEEEPYDEYEEEEDYYNENPIKMESKTTEIKKLETSSLYRTHTQKSPTQTQQVAVANPSKKYNVVQKQNGLVQTYTSRTTTETVPNGFRGTVNVEKKFHTKSLESQKAENKLNITADGDSAHKPRTPDSFVTVTKSITGSMDNSKNPPKDNKNFQSTYYTKSSTCGYFTFSCNIVYGANGRSKICRPKAPTNGKC